jgi:hypothetical protein
MGFEVLGCIINYLKINKSKINYPQGKDNIWAHQNRMYFINLSNILFINYLKLIQLFHIIIPTFNPPRVRLHTYI